MHLIIVNVFEREGRHKKLFTLMFQKYYFNSWIEDHDTSDLLFKDFDVGSLSLEWFMFIFESS